MHRANLRLTLLVLALFGALGMLYLAVQKPGGAKVQMVDAPCPPRPAEDAAKPVRFDWVELCRYQADNAKLIASGQPVRAVLFGDSITEWWREGDPSLFADGIINRGITGQTSQQLVLRFRQDVVALRPKVVVLQGGMNDIMGNTGLIGPDAYIANFETLLDLAEAHGIEPVIASLPAAREIPGRKDIAVPPRAIDLNRRLKSLAARRGVVYADLFGPLVGSDGGPRSGVSTDGLHLTTAGYAALRPVIDAALTEALARSGRKEPRP